MEHIAIPSRYQELKRIIAKSAKTIPIPCLNVRGSFKMIKANTTVTNGYRADVVTTTEVFPLLTAITKNSAPSIPKTPVRTA